MTNSRDILIELSKKYGFEDVLTQYRKETKWAMFWVGVLSALLVGVFYSLFEKLGV